MSITQSLCRLALAGAAALHLSGCFLQTISGATFAQDGSLITTVETDSILATCVQGGFATVNVECSYFFINENGVPVETTSSAQLISEFGILGVIIDPLIYQIPGNAANISGTYTDGAQNSGALEIRSGFKSIPIDFNRNLLADPGHQFVIAELPDAVPFENVQFNFSLRFEQPAGSATPVVVKPMLAMKYEGGGQEFYPPFLPCAQDMSSVPSVAIPLAASPQPISVASLPQGCSGEQFLLLGFGVFPCDFDGDDDVDAEDLAIQSRARNAPALPGDRMDADASGYIDLNDVRACALQCLQPRCAVIDPPPRATRQSQAGEQS